MNERFAEYRNFRELAAAHREGADYEIRNVARSPAVIIVAPHAGKIEPVTDLLAAEIAGTEYSLYCFLGKLPLGNRRLHITSHRFDEPTAVAAVERAQVVLAVHGAAGDQPWTMVGGRDRALAVALEANLAAAGFQLLPCPPQLSATSASNICNRGRSGAGAQIELSRAQRDILAHDPELLRRYAEAVRLAIQGAERKSRR